MGAISVGRRISASLDPVLMPAGFAAGQYGEGGKDRPERTQVIFCADHDEFSDQHPWMPQANEQERGVGACVDLVIQISESEQVEFIELEGLSLDGTLRRVGLAEDASRSADLVGSPVADVLTRIPAVLTRLFQARPERSLTSGVGHA